MGPSWVPTSGPAGTIRSEMTRIYRTSRTPGTPMNALGFHGKEGVAGSSPAEGLQVLLGTSRGHSAFSGGSWVQFGPFLTPSACGKRTIRVSKTVVGLTVHRGFESPRPLPNPVPRDRGRQRGVRTDRHATAPSMDSTFPSRFPPNRAGCRRGGAPAVREE